MSEKLLGVLEACGRDASVRAVILTGEGKAFCSGADIGAIASFLTRGEHPPSVLFQDFVSRLHRMIVEIRRMPKPVLGVVNGVAAGGGLSLALACDLIIASEAACFTLAHTRLGLSADGGSTFFLPRLLGPARAAALVLLNPSLDAQEALQWGLVSHVFSHEVLQEKAFEMAQKLADGPTQAYARVKDLVNGGWHNTLETQLEDERRHIMEASMTEDFREGVPAFLDKRHAQFKGA
jgi:2-(1,2-epoxy-1,2-dihydrophenyl)acetyl-CoA isomerase